GRRILRQTIDCDMELHGGAEKTLQQRIVQLLRDAGPLREPFFKADIEALGHLAHSEAVENQGPKDTGQQRAKAEPPRLPEHRLDFEVDGGRVAVPDAVRVTCDHTKTIR